ncbi:hypothetical protein QAD02_014071 [Eretmocerus hayati]|uniref:Uncharacterized protein n=1 Tax=Eretmocerus hayati TaxID=131215 RepID=A0ACC2P4P0_9HYME|nr:hypothetical protein QAD02_014071 [Eretmocerus hayati]
MHHYLAGVVKQLLIVILDSLTPELREVVNFHLKKIRAPVQIGKLSKEAKFYPHWKCKDFENFALYFSIPVFTAVIDDQSLLEDWALLVDSLHVALRMDITIQEIEYANAKLNAFMRDISEVYTLKEATFNAHQTTHLMQSVYDWGPLWAHSAFCFETWNMYLVNSIHSEKGIILQVLRAMNLRRFEQILQAMMGPTADEIVKSYCQRLKCSRPNGVVTIDKISYLGKKQKVDVELVRKFNIKSSMEQFSRCIIKGCSFMNDKKENARSCNYFAQLKGGQYIKISHFLVDFLNKDQLTVCRTIDVVHNRFSETVMEIKSFSDQEFLVRTDDIETICVQVDIDNLKYITPVPNQLHY